MQQPSRPNIVGRPDGEAAENDDEISAPSSIPASMRQSESSESSEESDSIEEDEEFQVASEDEIEMEITDISTSPPQKRKESSAPLSFVKLMNSATPPQLFSLAASKKTNRAVQQQLSSYVPEMEAFSPMDCDSPEAGPSVGRGDKRARSWDNSPGFRARRWQPYGATQTTTELKEIIDRCERNEVLFQTVASHALSMLTILQNKHSDYEAQRKELERLLQEKLNM